MNEHEKSRRDFIKLLGTVAVASQFQGLLPEAGAADVVNIDPTDRVFIANEAKSLTALLKYGLTRKARLPLW